MSNSSEMVVSDVRVELCVVLHNFPLIELIRTLGTVYVLEGRVKFWRLVFTYRLQFFSGISGIHICPEHKTYFTLKEELFNGIQRYQENSC